MSSSIRSLQKICKKAIQSTNLSLTRWLYPHKSKLISTCRRLRSTLGQSYVLIQDGIDIQELPWLVKRLGPSDFSSFNMKLPLASMSYTAADLRGHSCHENLFSKMLQDCESVMQIIRLLEIPGDHVTASTAAYALIRIAQLKMSSLSDDTDSFIKKAVLNELCDTVCRDVQVLSNDFVINLTECLMKSICYEEKFVENLNAEIERRIVKSSFKMNQLCDLLTVLSECVRNNPETLRTAWIHLGSRYKEIDCKNITDVYQTLRNISPEFRYLFRLADKQLQTCWWTLNPYQVACISRTLTLVHHYSGRTLVNLGKWLGANIHSIDEDQLRDVLSLYDHFDFSDSNVVSALERYLSAWVVANRGVSSDDYCDSNGENGGTVGNHYYSCGKNVRSGNDYGVDDGIVGLTVEDWRGDYTEEEECRGMNNKGWYCSVASGERKKLGDKNEGGIDDGGNSSIVEAGGVIGDKEGMNNNNSWNGMRGILSEGAALNNKNNDNNNNNNNTISLKNTEATDREEGINNKNNRINTITMATMKSLPFNMRTSSNSCSNNSRINNSRINNSCNNNSRINNSCNNNSRSNNSRINKSSSRVIVSMASDYCRNKRLISTPILNSIAEDFLTNSHLYSTRDGLSVLNTFGRLSYLPPDPSLFYQTAEIWTERRLGEFTAWEFLELLASFIYVERYPVNFVNRVLNSQFASGLREIADPLVKHKASKHFLEIQASFLLEFPIRSYAPLIQKDSLKLSLTWLDGRNYKIHKEVASLLKDFIGPESFTQLRIPKHTPHLINFEIKLDNRNVCRENLEASVVCDKKLALLVKMPEDSCINSNHLLGEYATKKRQLEKLNYDVVMIDYEIFCWGSKSQLEKIKYLKSLLLPFINFS